MYQHPLSLIFCRLSSVKIFTSGEAYNICHSLTKEELETIATALERFDNAEEMEIIAALLAHVAAQDEAATLSAVLLMSF